MVISFHRFNRNEKTCQDDELNSQDTHGALLVYLLSIK